MIVAVTYENGQVFQHFGHTEQFKVYRVQGGEAQGRGHLLMIGCKLHGEQEAHAGRRSPSQILSSPEEPRFPARLLLALPPRAWLSGSAAQHRGLLIIFFYSRR